jgi:hypothetical protein
VYLERSDGGSQRRTSVSGLDGGNFQGAIDIEELHLLLAIVEDGAHNVAVGSRDGAVVVVVAEGILARHQGGVADGRGQGDVAAEGHDESVDDGNELHFEDDKLGSVPAAFLLACSPAFLLSCC